MNLTTVSRRLTLSRGLSGFTIDEVCVEVGVSRRTFFNYFPSKEDAIIGVASTVEAQALIARFLGQGPRGFGTVVEDLVDLIVEHFDAVGVDTAEHLEFMSVLEREPRLMTRFIGVSRERERQLAMLVAQREGVDADDPRAEAAVAILAALVRTSVDRFLAANSHDYSPFLLDGLAAYRAVLGDTPFRKSER